MIIGKRKEKKDSKKDRGYAALEGESSPDEDTDSKSVGANIQLNESLILKADFLIATFFSRSPSKSKKSKSFKFPTKKSEKREKSREKDVKEKEKEPEKERKKEKDKKDKDKVKHKEKKKNKHGEEQSEQGGKFCFLLLVKYSIKNNNNFVLH